MSNVKTSKTIMAPFRLDEGIYLEAEDLVLPWRTDFSQLSKLNPTKEWEANEIRHFLWEDKRIFGGLPVNLGTTSSTFPFYWIRLREAEELSGAREEYTVTKAIMLEKLGDSPEVGQFFAKDGFPPLKWKFGQVEICLNLHERFLEYVGFGAGHIGLTKQPTGAIQKLRSWIARRFRP